MKMATITICCAAVMLLAPAGCSSPPVAEAGAAAEPGTASLRVGVFDSRGVALAYGRSGRPDCMLATVADIRTAYGEAEREGDDERMRELETEAQSLQRQMHAQVFSGAPIDGILAMLEADLPSVAEAADVSLIVAEVLHRGPGVELVDVTQEMCAPFEPDDDTRAMIDDLIAKPVVPESEMLHDH